jgi:hypothetical protein
MLADQRLSEAAKEIEKAEMEARRQEAMANLRLEESQEVKTCIVSHNNLLPQSS